MTQQKFTVQVTTLPNCDINQFDGAFQIRKNYGYKKGLDK
jgi:hypothetical protein